MSDWTLHGDRPSGPGDPDLLERGHIVDQLAGWVRSAPLDDGFVIGLTGPWGLGKTSLLMRLEAELAKDATVVWFEPWLFSGADQLVNRFFDEIAAELTGSGAKRARKVGSRMAEYGAALSPAATLVGGIAGQALAAPKRLMDLNQTSASAQRRDLRASLKKHPHRIVVLIDDIDRLSADEVREVMRLVKLVADLPGITHVLSYDRARVERALGDGHEDGRAYLEKIVQASMAVPPVSRDRLRKLTVCWLREAIGERSVIPWDQERWTSMLDGGIDRYLQTLRDGRRLANMVPAALDLHLAEVSSVDIVALEAVRVFDPDVHQALPAIVDILVGGGRHAWVFGATSDAEGEVRERLENVVGGPAHVATRKILAELFPAAGHLLGGSRESDPFRWRAEKRVASEPVLMRYLHLALGPAEVASKTVDEGLLALSDAEALRALLERIEPERIADLLDRVRARVDEVEALDVIDGALVLLEFAPALAHTPGFDLNPARRVRWLIEAMLATVEPQTRRADVAAELVDRIPNLSQRLEMAMRLKLPEESSQEPQLDLIPPDALTPVLERLCAGVRSATPESLAEEPQLLWLLQTVRDVAGLDAIAALMKHPAVLRALLEREGTSVRPLTSGRISLHIASLLELGGDSVTGELRDLLAAGELSAELADALQSELADPSRV